MPEPTVAAVSAAIARLLADPELRARLGEAGRVTARDYTWERRIDELEAFLEGVASTPVPPASPGATHGAASVRPAAMSVATDLVTSAGGLLAILLALGAGPGRPAARELRRGDARRARPGARLLPRHVRHDDLLEFSRPASTYPLLVALALASAASPRRARCGRRARPPSLRDVAQLLVVCVAVAAPLRLVLHERHSVGPAATTSPTSTTTSACRRPPPAHSLSDARDEWRAERAHRRAFGDSAGSSTRSSRTSGRTSTRRRCTRTSTQSSARGRSTRSRRFSSCCCSSAASGRSRSCGASPAKPTWMAVAGRGAVRRAAVPRAVVRHLPGRDHRAGAAAAGRPAGRRGAWRPRGLRTSRCSRSCSRRSSPSTRCWIPPLVRVGAGALGMARGRGAPPGCGTGALARALRGAGARRGRDDRRRSIPWPSHAPSATTPRCSATTSRSRASATCCRSEVLPGWLLQTREFWFLTPLGAGGFKPILFGALIPLVFAGFAGLAIRRLRIAIVLLALGVAFGLAAVYAYRSADACTYCGQRYLLGLAPILVVLLALGLWQSLRSPSRIWRVAGIAGALLVVAAVGQRARVELDRFADTSFFFDIANRSALEELPDRRPAGASRGLLGERSRAGRAAARIPPRQPPRARSGVDQPRHERRQRAAVPDVRRRARRRVPSFARTTATCSRASRASHGPAPRRAPGRDAASWSARGDWTSRRTPG